MEGATHADSGHLTAEQRLQRAEFALLRQQNDYQQYQLRQHNKNMEYQLKQLKQQIEDKETQLREQNEDLQRQLKHLQRDMTVVMFLQRSNNALHTSPKTQFTRFSNLPLETRNMIWELAVPSRLLRGECSSHTVVPPALSVPAVAQVCRESRRVVLRRMHVTARSARETIFGGQSQLWRLRHDEEAGCWTWFTSFKDILLVDPLSDSDNRHRSPIIRVAEHIVIEDCRLWEDLLPGNVRQQEDEAFSIFSRWVRNLVPPSEGPASAGTPSYNLRTVDFAMCSVSMIDRNYPPGFVHRLFDGNYVKIVDLRDRKAVRRIERMMVDEVSQFMEPKQCLQWREGLNRSWKIFRAARATLFKDVKASFLEQLAMLYHKEDFVEPQIPRGALPGGAEQGMDSEEDKTSEKDVGSELDMVPLDMWVKELTEQLDIRPVHVFIRVDGMADHGW